MGDTEIRRVMRVVFNAVELVREAYRDTTDKDTAHAHLERAGKALWEVQGLLVSESPERHRKRLRDSANMLRKLAVPLHRSKRRDVADALADTGDALSAYATIAQISIEAGLVG